MKKNPGTVEIVVEGEPVTCENVKTWWYDDLDLIVLNRAGEKTRYPNAVVV
jgi:hypothetical protein